MCEVNMTLRLRRFCKLFFLLVCLAPLHGCHDCDSPPVRFWVELICVEIQSPGVFVDETATRLPAVLNFAVRAAVGDVDGDNDLDLVVASGGHTSFLLYLPKISSFRSTTVLASSPTRRPHSFQLVLSEHRLLLQ